MSSSSNLSLTTVVFVLILVVIQIGFSNRKSFIPGIILPLVFLILFLYNLIKPIIVTDPYPTMKEGFLMTFGLIGFLIATLTLYIVKVVRRSIKRD